ncbi:MAG: glycosyltransferase family 4 protein [Chlamydiales bacterium]|nr:glycosyltransferase family 4 protein [Chlamydiales bacterium]
MSRVILHTEASLGFGGQEMRILKEARQFRAEGFEVILAAHPDAKLFLRMQEEGFLVYPIRFKKKNALSCIFKLLRVIKKHRVDIINTHSSTDAWLGGIAGRISRTPIIRTRHLSTAIKSGLNSRILYNVLVDYVITTCEEIVPVIRQQARLKKKGCKCIATGVDSSVINVSSAEVEAFRKRYGIEAQDCVIGTLCVLRSWKGLSDFSKAAHLLKNEPNLKWLIVGSGGMTDILSQEIKEYGLEGKVILTGHLEPPFIAIAAMDIFALLSTSNEGISQATLQAAYLQKPLITTPTGGLREVCLSGITGILVEKKSPEQVAKAVEELLDEKKRAQYGRAAHALVIEKYTFQRTIEETKRVYNRLLA